MIKYNEFFLNEKLTWLETVKDVLSKHTDGLSAAEIWEFIKNNNLIETKAKDPLNNNIYPLLQRHTDNISDKRSGFSYFTSYGSPRIFKLKEKSSNQVEKDDLRVFVVRAGVSNTDSKLFIDGNFVAIDYGLNFDISNKSKEEIMEFLIQNGAHKSQALQYVQQIELFKEISVGDIVLVPDSGGINVGEVSSEIYYTTGRYPNRLEVEWLDKIGKNSSVNLPRTVFEIKNFDTENYEFTSNEIFPEEQIEFDLPGTDEESPKTDIQTKKPLDANSNEREENPFRQCICILGDPGVGKSVTAIETIKKDDNHKLYLSIPTDLSTSMLVQFIKGELVLNRISKMIVEAYKNPNIKYTVLIDEFHKPLTIKRVNDELLQAISTKRYRERRFISSEIAESFITPELQEFGFTEEQYSYHGNIEIPRNFGFILLSSKPNVILDNEDLYDRMDIVYLRETDKNQINNIEELKRRTIHKTDDKRNFKYLIKSKDDEMDGDSRRESFDNFLDNITNESIKESFSAIIKFTDWRNL